MLKRGAQEMIVRRARVAGGRGRSAGLPRAAPKPGSRFKRRHCEQRPFPQLKCRRQVRYLHAKSETRRFTPTFTTRRRHGKPL